MGVGQPIERRAVFLDRDGVINRAIVRDGRPYPPDSVAEMRILDGVAVALVALRQRGFLNIVVTNQPDVATGKQSVGAITAMHECLMKELAIDEILVCMHTDADSCSCRKPKPGMLIDAAQRYGIDLGRSYLIGDRWRDIAAGQAAGCTCFFIDYNYRERRPDPPFIARESLYDASESILADFAT